MKKKKKKNLVKCNTVSETWKQPRYKHDKKDVQLGRYCVQNISRSNILNSEVFKRGGEWVLMICLTALGTLSSTDPKITLGTTLLYVFHIYVISDPKSQILIHYTFTTNLFQVTGHLDATRDASAPNGPDITLIGIRQKVPYVRFSRVPSLWQSFFFLAFFP